MQSSDYDAVVEQLKLEFSYVGLVQTRIGLVASLLTQVNGTVDQLIETVFTDTIGNPSSSSDMQAQDWLDIVSEIASIGWALAGLATQMPEIGATLGSFSSVLALGATADNLADGSSVLQVQLATTEADWQKQAANFFTQSQSAVQGIGGLLPDDWGKLEAVGTRISDPVMYPGWTWVISSGGTSDQASQAFNVAMLREFYVDSQHACSSLELNDSYGASYFGSTTPSGYRVVFSKVLCQAVQDAPSLAKLQVLEPLGSCMSIPCPLGLARVEFLWTTFQSPIGDCPACGIFSDCTPCGEHSGCTASPAMAPPC